MPQAENPQFRAYLAQCAQLYEEPAVAQKWELDPYNRLQRAFIASALRDLSSPTYRVSNAGSDWRAELLPTGVTNYLDMVRVVFGEFTGIYRGVSASTISRGNYPDSQVRGWLKQSHDLIREALDQPDGYDFEPPYSTPYRGAVEMTIAQRYRVLAAIIVMRREPTQLREAFILHPQAFEDYGTQAGASLLFVGDNQYYGRSLAVHLLRRTMEKDPQILLPKTGYFPLEAPVEKQPTLLERARSLPGAIADRIRDRF